MTQLTANSPLAAAGPLLAADRMLGRLARRLRLLGYDCLLVDEHYSTGLTMLEQLTKQDRRLLTASPNLAHEAREARTTRDAKLLLIPSKLLREQVCLVVEHFPLDIERLAFSRCSECNTLLKSLALAEAADRLPPLVKQQQPDTIKHCPDCAHLYWPGSHTKNIAAEFQQWTGRQLPTN